MNYIVLIICSIILPIISSIEIKPTIYINPKLCINCKNFITDNRNGKYGKCALFPTSEGNTNYLVNGIITDEYYYCSTSRESKICVVKKVNIMKRI